MSSVSHRPVYILTGFLGAGKTTLLNQILHENHNHRFAVIINEFGEVGLDADMIEGSQEFVKMDNGCLCCALNEDLVQTLDTLKDRDDYEAIVLETTGIADPLPVAWTFFRENLQGYFRFGGIITVVDALHFFDMLEEAEEVTWQVERADYIYLTKTDLAEASQIEKVKNKVQSLNPNARFVKQDDPKKYELMFDLSQELELSAATHSHHAEKFESLAFDLKSKTVSLDDMEDIFESLPKAVFRAKAIFQETHSKKFFVMHSVCGRVEFYETHPVTNLGVVFIGKNLDFDLLKSIAKFS